ncbi:MAG: hypothetical protein AAFV95_05145 [Bacteroidota bacterium]
MPSYLEKYALFPALISEAPLADVRLMIVIPSFDEPDLQKSLEALMHCQSLEEGRVEVITVINHSERAEQAVKERHAEQHQQLREWASEAKHPSMRHHILYCPDLPAKRAGVGIARKIGMDEAVRRFEQLGRPDGVIVCFDADSLCAENYLRDIDAYFRQHPDCPAVSIGYAHPLEGREFSDDIYQAITSYELHLRYFLLAKRWAGFPFAYETIGSAMAVRSWAYQAQGGMNKRKAGEDFYFLNKFTPLDHFGEIRQPLVFPSPRQSHRVPFGTGRAVTEALQSVDEYQTYSLASFRELKGFFDGLPQWYEQPALCLTSANEGTAIRQYLQRIDGPSRMEDIKRHTSSYESFRKRFFRWFDAFHIMKFVHFARDEAHPNAAVQQAAASLLTLVQGRSFESNSERELLEQYRLLSHAPSAAPSEFPEN